MSTFQDLACPRIENVLNPPYFSKWFISGTPLPQDWKCFESTLFRKVSTFQELPCPRIENVLNPPYFSKWFILGTPLPQDWKCFESTLFLSGLFQELPCPRVENVLNPPYFLKWVYFRKSIAPVLISLKLPCVYNNTGLPFLVICVCWCYSMYILIFKMSMNKTKNVLEFMNFVLKKWFFSWEVLEMSWIFTYGCPWKAQKCPWKFWKVLEFWI